MKVKLTEICQPKQWNTLPKSKLEKRGYPVYGANGIIGYYNKYNHEYPTILITCRGATCGTVNISKEKAYINGNAMCLDKLSNKVLLKYLYYYLKFYNFKNVISGSAQPQITIENLRKLYVKITDITKQQKIVDSLEKIDKIINIRKKQLEKMNLFVKSLFMETFNDPIKNNMNWEVKKLKDLCLKIGSGATPKGGQSVYIDKGTSFIRSMNVYNGYFKYNGLAHINENHAKQLENVSLKENDILLNITGASVARSCIVPKNLLPARVNQHVALIRVNKEKINPIFLNHVFITDSFQKYLLNISASNGATRQAITKQQIEELNIIVPSSKLVDLYVKKVQQIDKSKLAIQQSLEQLKTLKKSLMQEYFG